jgi:hypothetical protein
LGVGALVLSFLLTGVACAQRNGGTPGGGNVTPTFASSGQPSGLPSSGEPEPSAAAASTTIRGRVVEGVELGCLLLEATDGTAYLLIGGDRDQLVAGRRLEVTGRVEPDLMTTCQQGTPFQVSDVRPI